MTSLKNEERIKQHLMQTLSLYGYVCNEIKATTRNGETKITIKGVKEK